MKVYKVKVNGKVYEVELESVSENDKHLEAPAATVSKPAQATNGEGTKLNAPMAGTILNVKVSVGQNVNAGDVVCILEAMKLENEVVAPVSGQIKAIEVSKGSTVTNGQLIAIIG